MNPKVVPNKMIFPNSIKAVFVNPLSPPTLINSKTNTATKAPIGSIRIPSHFNTADTSFFNGIFRKIGVITVGPVTIIKAENSKEICHDNPKIKCAAKPAAKNVIAAPSVINLVITGPRFLISLRFNVSPPSKSIILIARDTKEYNPSPGKRPLVPFQIGSIHLVPSSLKNVAATGPTSNPIRIKGRIAGILNFQATHCANIPKMMIPASSNISRKKTKL